MILALEMAMAETSISKGAAGLGFYDMDVGVGCVHLDHVDTCHI